MNKSKIEWCDRTWNPITGCLNDCPYCYAHGIARRFGGGEAWWIEKIRSSCENNLYELLVKPEKPYPFYFEPTFHYYRIDEPLQVKKPQNIFVGSMADMFGDWIPNEWITDVFKACEVALQHRYIFLTKNYRAFIGVDRRSKIIKSNHWFGISVTSQQMLAEIAIGIQYMPTNCFLSIEPLHGEIDLNSVEPPGNACIFNLLTGGRSFPMDDDIDGIKIKWVIVGAETGNRKGKIIPKREWVENIVNACCAANVPVFLKNNLADIWGEPLIQEYPWEVIK